MRSPVGAILFGGALRRCRGRGSTLFTLRDTPYLPVSGWARIVLTGPAKHAVICAVQPLGYVLRCQRISNRPKCSWRFRRWR